MANIKQEIVRFTRPSGRHLIEVLITKERGKPEIVTSILTEKQTKFLKLEETNNTWKSYAQASAKLRAYGWVKMEDGESND